MKGMQRTNDICSYNTDLDYRGTASCSSCSCNSCMFKCYSNKMEVECRGTCTLKYASFQDKPPAYDNPAANDFLSGHLVPHLPRCAN